jgi:predicted Zn-dependent protease
MTFLELEKECKKRRLKKALKFFIVLAVLFLFGFLAYSYLNSHASKPKPSQKKEVFPKKTVKKDVNISKSKPLKAKKQKIEKLSLYLDFNVTSLKKTGKIKKENTVQKPPQKKPVLLEANVLPSYETCIKLAEKYYMQKDYENALKWAKNANLQNNKKPQSWIISAKALYKLGKKHEAVRILRIYYNYSKNKEVLKLLKEMNE